MLLPTLEALEVLGGSATIGELDSKVIEILKLPEDMQNILHKEGSTQTVVEYRLSWARTYLKKYGLINNSSRGVWSFSDSFDGNISNLSSDEIVRKVRADNKQNQKYAKFHAITDEGDGELTETPIDWREKLRDVLLKMDPKAFERLTLRILRESGFTQVEVTGRPNDGGTRG
jgi:restriction system protein